MHFYDFYSYSDIDSARNSLYHFISEKFSEFNKPYHNLNEHIQNNVIDEVFEILQKEDLFDEVILTKNDLQTTIDISNTDFNIKMILNTFPNRKEKILSIQYSSKKLITFRQDLNVPASRVVEILKETVNWLTVTLMPLVEEERQRLYSIYNPLIEKRQTIQDLFKQENWCVSYTSYKEYEEVNVKITDNIRIVIHVDLNNEQYIEFVQTTIDNLKLLPYSFLEYDDCFLNYKENTTQKDYLENINNLTITIF